MAATPVEIAEMVEWFIATVAPLIAENGWQISFNGNSGTVQAELRMVQHSTTETGDKRRIEIRDSKEFRLKRQKAHNMKPNRGRVNAG